MTADSEPLVSVVTPVYNGEQYLAECIESVLSQSYHTWEYIIVNNCSTDRTLEIAEAYNTKDRRIQVHSNDRLVGVIENHNRAFRYMSPKSKYCKVVHADDWLFRRCIEEMVTVAEANPSVGIVSSYRLDGDRVSLDGLPYPSTLVPGRSICRSSLLGGAYVFGSPTSLLIRSDLIRNRDPFFNNSNLHADTEACYEILQDSDFGFVHQVLTYTRRHEESETSFARRMNTYILGSLTVLIKYGRTYLSDEEYEGRLIDITNQYYGFLARSVFYGREREFWDYHRNGLERLGHPYRWSKLVKALFVLIIDRLFNPKATIQGQIRRMVGRKN